MSRRSGYLSVPREMKWGTTLKSISAQSRCENDILPSEQVGELVCSQIVRSKAGKNGVGACTIFARLRTANKPKLNPRHEKAEHKNKEITPSPPNRTSNREGVGTTSHTAAALPSH
mmetsp:Transcript_8995/g.21331  ORF Transcript_8995/g.21331 Transcript_8995/m.21331 type:complete len:116 (-) Transcript_8995:7-354(-)|eukprot:3091038-Rhodomonas_salina.1